MFPIGVFKLLAVVPMWAIALFILVTTIAVPFIIADRATGLFFNFSYSGVVGDACLIVVVLIGVTVIQRGAPLPLWFAGVWPQVILATICIAIGVLLVTMSTPWPIETWPDRYHNASVVPILLFLVPMMILVIFFNGTRIEWSIGLLLVMIWAVLVVYDFHDNRMNQPARLEKMFGIELVDGRFVRK